MLSSILTTSDARYDGITLHVLYDTVDHFLLCEKVCSQSKDYGIQNVSYLASRMVAKVLC